ncbi:hypothetical protein LSAT2_023466, partial [Lamellibrachia satsuma]
VRYRDADSDRAEQHYLYPRFRRSPSRELVDLPGPADQRRLGPRNDASSGNASNLKHGARNDSERRR